MIRVVVLAAVIAWTAGCVVPADAFASGRDGGANATPTSDEPARVSEASRGERNGELDEVTVKLAEHTPGSTVVVPLGAIIEVQLAGNASTGYRWIFVDSGERVIEDTDERSVTLSDRRVGSGGVESRRLRARQPGQQTLIFEYRRPWEIGVAPLRSVPWTVQVAP